MNGSEPIPGKDAAENPAESPAKNPMEEGPPRRERYFVRGEEPWTSLEELAGSPELGDAIRAEYPPPQGEGEGWSRRNFLRLMGASMALAGVTGCGRGVGLPQGRERLLPYVRPPEGLVPGESRYYATTLTAAGDVIGVLGETHMGRPTKIEGNPDHPASLGATDLFAQAAVLELYDPSRMRTAFFGDLPRERSAFRDFLLERRLALAPRRGEGLRILTGEIRSPTLLARITALLREMPEARWHVFEPVGTAGSRRATELAFGRPLLSVPHLDRAEGVVGFGADPFGWGPGRVRMMHDWAAKRAVRDLAPAGDVMNRWYAAESHPTLTGFSADHRLRAPPARLPRLLDALARELGAIPLPGFVGRSDVPADEAGWIAAAAADLRRARGRGRGLVLAGETLPPESQALAHFLNGYLGNIGNTVTYVAPMEGEEAARPAAELAADLRAGRVDTLIVLGANPAYAGHPEQEWPLAVPRARHAACVSFYRDETARLCGWNAPMAHDLESWGDARAFDGSVSPLQPLIESLVPAWNPIEVLSVLGGTEAPDVQEIVREHWRPILGGSFDAAWREALRKGLLLTGSSIEPPALRPPGTYLAGSAAAGAAVSGPAPEPEGLEIEFRPDPTVWDGSYAFHPWLQETPKPFTKLVWENAVHLSPATAAALGLASRDEVILRYRGRERKAPVWVLPGQCDGVATVHLGYGRAWPGQRYWLEGDGAMPNPGQEENEIFGFNAYALRTADAPWHGGGLELRPTGYVPFVANAQEQARLEGRPIVRAADLSRLRENPDFCAEEDHPSLYPQWEYPDNAWGMTVDMTLCTGCAACVVACRAENNVPVVGKGGILRHRDMAWLRIDRYFIGPAESPAAYFQPMLCQHCEHAPCELVCPVEATLHSADGLNEMIYNRCIGTRYCSNNCPYKVRRFNFFDYARPQDPIAAPQRNPEVTVRGRGVMEKCTFCVQRINQARVDAGKGKRRILDGEADTACMQACPTGAIVFGDLNDRTARVTRLRAIPWKFKVLGQLNTRPRIAYLARIWNLNPALPAEKGKQLV